MNAVNKCDAHSYFQEVSINMNMENVNFSCNLVVGFPMILNFVTIKSISPYHHKIIGQLNATCNIVAFLSNGMICFDIYFQNFLELSFNKKNNQLYLLIKEMSSFNYAAISRVGNVMLVQSTISLYWKPKISLAVH